MGALLSGILLIAIFASTVMGALPVISHLDTALLLPDALAPGNNRRGCRPLAVRREAPHNQRMQPTARIGKQACLRAFAADPRRLSLDWNPSTGEFGMAAMLAGSLAASLPALLLAAPLAVALAAWINLYAPGFLKRPMRALYELLAGIPSLVYGLRGLIALVPLVNAIAPPGASLLTASQVLAIMILLYGLLLVDSHFRQAPVAQKQAAVAAGLSPWGTFRCVYWPFCHRSIIRGMVLQFGRALGETMAVLTVAGNVVRLPDSLFAPGRTLTANIALEMGYASGDRTYW